MSLTLYNSIGWAVEKQTIAAGGGLTGPVLVSATSTDPNTVRLVFDRRLMLEYRQAGSVYHAATLDLASFAIAKVSGGEPLEVVRTIWINDTTIDLATANQQVFSYRVTCVAGGVMDFQGNVITLQTADFTGQQRTTYTTPSDIRMFTSGYPGMQEDLTNDFYPDLVAPYLQNQNPLPSAININPAANIYLEIRDDELGVDRDSIRIWIQGALAYRGDTNMFLAPYNGPGSSIVQVGPAWQVTIDPTSTFDEYLLITMRVYAQDLAPIFNTVDSTYTWRTWDHSGPLVDSYAPTGSGISKTTLITFSVDENSGSGVSLGSLTVDVDGAHAILGGVFQSGFDGPGSAIVAHHLGYDVTIQKTTPYPAYNLTDVDLYVQDLSGNITSFSWSFRIVDYLGPLVEPIDPTSGEVNVPSNSNISFKITDLDSVVASSIKVNIDQGAGVLLSAFDWASSPKFKPGFNGPGSGYTLVGGVYTITIDPTVDFLIASIARVEVLATDPSGNPARL